MTTVIGDLFRGFCRQPSGHTQRRTYRRSHLAGTNDAPGSSQHDDEIVELRALLLKLGYARFVVWAAEDGYHEVRASCTLSQQTASDRVARGAERRGLALPRVHRAP